MLFYLILSYPCKWWNSVACYRRRTEVNHLSFRNSTIFEAHGLAADSMIPFSFISSTCRSIISKCWNGCRRRGCLFGWLPPVSIRYSTSGVRPMSIAGKSHKAEFGIFRFSVTPTNGLYTTYSLFQFGSHRLDSHNIHKIKSENLD